MRRPGAPPRPETTEYPQHVIRRFPNIATMTQSERDDAERQLDEETNATPIEIDDEIPIETEEIYADERQRSLTRAPVITTSENPIVIDEIPIETQETNAAGTQSMLSKNELPDFWY